jgi:hypothetical protein
VWRRLKPSPDETDIPERRRCEYMATVQPWIPMTEKSWTDDEKEAWLADHGQEATHVVTFEPMYQVELCIPPWEHPDRQIARSAVIWGQQMNRVFTDDHDGVSAIVTAHHEGNALEIYSVVKPRPRLRRIQ